MNAFHLAIKIIVKISMMHTTSQKEMSKEVRYLVLKMTVQTQLQVVRIVTQVRLPVKKTMVNLMKVLLRDLRYRLIQVVTIC